MNNESNDMMYALEHRVITDLFYTHKGSFASGLINGKTDALYGLISDFFEANHKKCPYKKEDFGVEVCMAETEFPSKLNPICVIRLKYPEPEKNALCHYQYLFIDRNFEYPMMFTVEKADENDKFSEMMEKIIGQKMPEELKQPFLCHWEPSENGDYRHCNHQHVMLDENEILNRCFEAYVAKNSLL